MADATRWDKRQVRGDQPSTHFRFQGIPMTVRFHATSALALCAAAFFSVGAQAQMQGASSGGYIYGAVGRSHYNNDCTGLSECKNSGTASKLGGGYRFAGGWALEAVALNFGKSSAVDSSTRIKVELKGSGVSLGGAYFAELAPRVTAVLRLGVASIKLDASGALGNFRFSESERSTKLYSGIGVAYSFTDHFYGELAFDGTSAKYRGENSNLNSISAGLGLRF
jgi:opacity protein-like surface antigen